MAYVHVLLLLIKINILFHYLSHIVADCQGAAHKNCKEFVRITCQRDMRKYQRNSGNPNVSIEDDTHKTSKHL